MLEKTYFYLHSTYTSDLNELGFEQEKLVKDGGSANYLIEVTLATANGFKAKATAMVDFDGDGVFNVWEIDETKKLNETIKD
jgi:type IV pilus assembly protein PilE